MEYNIYIYIYRRIDTEDRCDWNSFRFGGCIIIDHRIRDNTRKLRGQHFWKFLVLKATFQKFLLGKLTVIIFVHSREDVLRSFFRAICRSVARACSEHVVYCLQTENNIVYLIRIVSTWRDPSSSFFILVILFSRSDFPIDFTTLPARSSIFNLRKNIEYFDRICTLDETKRTRFSNRR